jgi:hypothetical protein
MQEKLLLFSSAVPTNVSGPSPIRPAATPLLATAVTTDAHLPTYPKCHPSTAAATYTHGADLDNLRAKSEYLDGLSRKSCIAPSVLPTGEPSALAQPLSPVGQEQECCDDVSYRTASQQQSATACVDGLKGREQQPGPTSVAEQTSQSGLFYCKYSGCSCDNIPNSNTADTRALSLTPSPSTPGDEAIYIARGGGASNNTGVTGSINSAHIPPSNISCSDQSGTQSWKSTKAKVLVESKESATVNPNNPSPLPEDNQSQPSTQQAVCPTTSPGSIPENQDQSSMQQAISPGYGTRKNSIDRATDPGQLSVGQPEGVQGLLCFQVSGSGVSP